MKSNFKDRVDFSQSKSLHQVPNVFYERKGKVSAKKIYIESLAYLKKETGLETVEEILDYYMEKDTISRDEIKCLRSIRAHFKKYTNDRR